MADGTPDPFGGGNFMNPTGGTNMTDASGNAGYNPGYDPNAAGNMATALQGQGYSGGDIGAWGANQFGTSNTGYNTIFGQMQPSQTPGAGTGLDPSTLGFDPSLYANASQLAFMPNTGQMNQPAAAATPAASTPAATTPASAGQYVAMNQNAPNAYTSTADPTGSYTVGNEVFDSSGNYLGPTTSQAAGAMPAGYGQGVASEIWGLSQQLPEPTMNAEGNWVGMDPQLNAQAYGLPQGVNYNPYNWGGG